MKKAKQVGAKILTLPEDRRDKEKLLKIVEQAAEIIKSGGTVILPSETSYGVAADATNEEAVKKVLALKENVVSDWGIPICVSDLRMAAQYCELSAESEFLARSFMPGPLTLVVERKNLPKTLSKEGIAFRISGNFVARLLAQESDKPITFTGARAAGTPAVYKIDEIKQKFSDKVDAIIDAGNLPPILPSTVIDMRSKPPKILREGPLSAKEILSQLEWFAKEGRQ